MWVTIAKVNTLLYEIADSGDDRTLCVFVLEAMRQYTFRNGKFPDGGVKNRRSARNADTGSRLMALNEREQFIHGVGIRSVQNSNGSP